MQHHRCTPEAHPIRHPIQAMLSSDLVRSVLDSAPDAMIVIDSAGTILFANRQVTALFGYGGDEVVGFSVELLLPERFRARHTAHRDRYARNVRVRPMGMGLDLFGRRKDGSEFPVEISLSPIRQGDEDIVAAAIRDVTERRQVEQAVRDARREAEHATLAKSRFLATASHDLRQPLQTLGLLNGALRRMTRDAECLEVLDQQEQAVDAMSRLLNALLDISKLESGVIKLDLTDFDLAPLLEQLRRDFSGLAATKGLRLAFDTPPVHVHSDPALVSQVLRNLMSNAIKYTHSGSVELRCANRGDRLRIEVRDTGVGIAPENVGLIFEEFYQVGVSPNSSRDGYGLGLSIVNRIARLLEIRIQVSSEVGKGSTFAFELPTAAAPMSRAAESGEPGRRSTAPPGGARRILLVEDEPSVRNAMRMLFKIEGYEVVPVATADEALARLRAEPFDLMVTDYHLEGGRTGTQVIAAARELLGPGVKAVLVTGDTSSAVREMQGDARLRITSKPINSDELLALVRDLLLA
ncbi:MAG TPA: hybrid sensor histidine kinase/response regulator [Steroidobacteraceae bacterium]|nr:hybrid sensor histidine kinase/response regulator [Steroidobacteraceae bacterium]